MLKAQKRKLTKEEKKNIIFVINDLLAEKMPKEATEYDVLMQKKLKEFTLHLLKPDEIYKVEVLLDMCNEYISSKKSGNPKGCVGGLGIIIMYDMWLNKSGSWPVMGNPEWKEWEKLKEKKIIKKKGVRRTSYLSIKKEGNYDSKTEGREGSPGSL